MSVGMENDKTIIGITTERVVPTRTHIHIECILQMKRVQTCQKFRIGNRVLTLNENQFAALISNNAIDVLFVRFLQHWLVNGAIAYYPILHECHTGLLRYGLEQTVIR